MAKNIFSNKEEFKKEFNKRIAETYGRSTEETSIEEKFIVLGTIVRDYASYYNWKKTKDTVTKNHQKQLYYFSMEFLIGRLMTSNLMNLGIYNTVEEGLRDLNIDINAIENMESDPGLGNGGLGRLAACFLDSASSNDYPMHGNCIRYEYGLFKQEIKDQRQIEMPDQWLKLGNVWEVRKPQHSVDVHFFGNVDYYIDENGKRKYNHHNTFVIKAIPYDMAVIGNGTKVTNTLRLWSAECAGDAVDYANFEKYIQDVRAINHNVYPDDSTESGRYLRLKQQYFFVAAGLNSIIKNHLSVYKTLDNLADKVVIQLNDTHPVLAIPELMRILMDEYEYEWNDAWNITTQVFAYTNHTVLAEALEKWPINFIQTMLPRIYLIIEEIHNRFCYDLYHVYNVGDIANNMFIMKDGMIHMAHLAIVGSFKVNGVAALHTDILKNVVMKDFYKIWPEKFINMTNGITHRRWLAYTNTELTQLIESKIGNKFIKDASKLEDLMNFVEDKKLQADFLKVKKLRKQVLLNYLKEQCGIKDEIDVNSIFDVQCKRIHAYKRQLLNVLHIIYLYFEIKNNPNFTMHPRTFFFSGKAAPAYVFAKNVIHLIVRLQNIINNDPQVNKFIKVIFIPNYSVSIAERLFNAADVSEQISTAGKEASGTGNMKFMMNGAITLGTLDGANVEICERVGIENIIIFGLDAAEVFNLKATNSYFSRVELENNPKLKRVVDSLSDGTFNEYYDEFKPIIEDLIYRNDEYLLLKDFNDYVRAQGEVEKLYTSDKWAEKCLINIAKSGYFSSDRTIEEYAKNIWNLTKVEVK